MHRLKVVIASVLAVMIVFGTVSASFASSPSMLSSGATSTDATPTDNSPSEEKKGFSFGKSIFDVTIPAIDTDQFFGFVNTIRKIFGYLTGRFSDPAPMLDVEVSDDVAGFLKIISDNSVLDDYKILTNIPDIGKPVVIANQVFEINTGELRDELYAARSIFREKGMGLAGAMCRLAGVYIGGMTKAYVYLLPVTGEDYLQITLDVTYADGSVEVYHTPIYINPETGEAFGVDEKGMLYTGFNCSIYDLMVYAPIECWMRDFGFCIEYDLLCYVLPVYRYHTRRVKFDYQGKEWMVQLWKGNYLITNGGEVGVYNRDPVAFGSYYNCITNEELLPMSLRISHGDDVLVNIPEQPHWWVNGFKLANNLYPPQSLTLDFTITAYDEEFLNALCEGIDNNFHHDIEYTVDGLTLHGTWAG